MKPPDADFGITIDFKRGASDPLRVFEAITELLDGLSELDRVLLSSIDPRLEPVMILEDVEAGSITVWVKNAVQRIEDDALRSLDWRKQFGPYLVKAKYRALTYLDEHEAKNERRRLERLRDDLSKLGIGVHPSLLPMSAPIDLPELVKPLDQIQDAKQLLSPSDHVIFKTDEIEHEVNLSSTKRPSDLLEEEVASTKSGQMPMILLVRRPDYLGNSQWEFRHGKSAISAHVLDEKWLTRFRTGQEVITPGSALECMVEYNYSYNEQGELKSAKFSIQEVLRTIHNRASGETADLWDDDNSR